MKNKFKGIIIGIFLTLLFVDVVYIWSETKSYRDFSAFEKAIYKFALSPTLGLWVPLTGRCTTQESIEYFGCNYLQIKLNRKRK